MKRRILLGVSLSTLFLTACRTIQPVVNQNEVFKKTTAAQVRSAILKAGNRRGWQMKEINDHLIQAKYVKNQHVGIVDITYNANSYTLSPNPQSTLMYSDGKIHKHFQRWINTLKQDIDTQLQRQS